MGNSVGSSISTRYDLGWGHSVCVRQAFLSAHGGSPLILSEDDLIKYNYPEHEGDKEVIALTRQIIRRQLGLEYKHIVLTNGATGGVMISLRAFSQLGYEACETRVPPFYIRYPGMIKASGLKQTHQRTTLNEPRYPGEKVYLLDLPSNPIGYTDDPFVQVDGPLVLDGVYYNNVYTKGYIKPVPHDVFVGSYSKLLGLNGIRIGWIATDDDLLYDQLKELVTSEYCGLSMSDSILLKHLLRGFDWDVFEALARTHLNRNREEWSRLERYFEGRPVSDVGMFYYAKMDSSCKALMEKAGIKWTPGSLMGTDDSYGRFNLGQDCNLTKKVVKEVLKKDGLL